MGLVTFPYIYIVMFHSFLPPFSSQSPPFFLLARKQTKEGNGTCMS